MVSEFTFYLRLILLIIVVLGGFIIYDKYGRPKPEVVVEDDSEYYMFSRRAEYE